jgi:hypothetical protein
VRTGPGARRLSEALPPPVAPGGDEQADAIYV